MEFVETANIPSKQVSGVIADYRISDASVNMLNSIGINVIPSCAVLSLYNAVKGHPDMLIHHFGGNKFLTAPEAYSYFCSVLPEAEIIKGSKALSDKYPEDIAYNAAVMGDTLICSAEHTAPEITSSYSKILSVKQGYSKCSVCIVSDNAIITSDKGIYKTAAANGIDVLCINEGYIYLKGMSHGFIGGATGLISDNILAVNGNIKTHPDCDAICSFCKQYGVEILPLNDGDITDIGSIIPIFY